MTAQFSNGDHENGNGNGATTDAPPKPHLSTKDGFTFHDRVLLDDTAIGVGLANKRIDAVVQDGKRRHEETKNWRHELLVKFDALADDVASVKGGILELLAREHRQDADIEQVKRGSKADEYMQKAADAFLTVETQKKTQAVVLTGKATEADIEARRKRNAAIVKIAIAFGSALALGLSSLITWALTR